MGLAGDVGRGAVGGILRAVTGLDHLGRTGGDRGEPGAQREHLLGFEEPREGGQLAADPPDECRVGPLGLLPRRTQLQVACGGGRCVLG